MKINGVWVEVKDEDVKEGDEPSGDEPAGDEPKGDEPAGDEPAGDEPSGDEPAGDEPGGDEPSGDEPLKPEEKAAIKKEAKAAGKEIAKELFATVENKEIKKLRGQMERFIEINSPADSKLREILGGKDYITDSDQLTKEEKIVAFWYACVTNDVFALKALAEGVNADGGFLFPNEFLNELVKELPNINVMRNWVRIIPMKRNAMNITSLISGPQVTWTAENVAKSTTTLHFAQSTLTAYKVAAILYSSDELIEDSDIFDVVQLIIEQFAEAIADEEERVIWVGNGTTQPQGIDVAGTIATVAAVNQDGDDIVNLFRALPRKYRKNAAFFMNDTTAGNVEKLKDSNNRPLWVDGIATDGMTKEAPARLKGKPVVISDWVPDNTIFFGDMKKAYFFGDRKRMAVLTSQHTTQAFTQDETAIRVVARLGGLVVQPLAARELTGF